jgi:poly-gamma-glutamate synthesis protein (capsule biosynthesis protein)
MEARQAVVLKKKNICIGILGYTDNEPGWIARLNKPGTNYVSVGDMRKIREDVLKLRPQVDLLIVSIHWGPNMRERPTRAFSDFAHQLIDSGVDIIHGHSAHIFQGIERYKGKLILYDTGDFIDDYAVDPRLRNDRSFLFLVKLDPLGIRQIELIPVRIDAMQVNLAKGDDYRWSVERMKRLSADLGEFGARILEEPGHIFVK